MGQITEIFLLYKNNVLYDVILHIKYYQDATCSHFENLYQLYYMDNFSTEYITIDLVIARCFFITCKEWPKHNTSTIMAGIELQS